VRGRDVIQQLVRLGKPGDVAAWWGSEPGAHPDQWLHPLSYWEREYLQAMTSPAVPAPLRRSIVSHYVWSHPATIRLHLGLYGLFRDSNPGPSRLKEDHRRSTAL
jgi:hypothetical protein